LLGMFLSLKTLYRKRTVIWPFYFYTIIRTLSMMELEHIDVLITSKDFGFDEILFYTLYLLLILIILYYLKKQVKTKS
ncbi:protein msa, partial [Staphylococcus aureus VET1515S]